MSESLDRRSNFAPWRDALWIVLLAPALVAGCYSAGFLSYDDGVHYAAQQALPDYPLSDVWKPRENTYFPVTVLSYRIDRFLFEKSPPPSMKHSTAAPWVRLHSLLLHILAGIFLWRALLHLKYGRWLSLFGAGVWVLHPQACESVCWISERKNVLAAFFGFASLWVYLGGVKCPTRKTVSTAFLFVLALLSKPAAAGFLPIYFAYDAYVYWMMRGEWSDLARSSSSRITIVLRPAILYVICIGVIVSSAKLNLGMSPESYLTRAGGSLWHAALTDVPILNQYIFDAIVPGSLSIFYYSPIVVTPWSIYFGLNAAILGSVVAGSIWISPNRPRTIFLWGWFVGALGPALNIIPLPYLMQDRFAYYSLPAILILAAETVIALFAKLNALQKSTAPDESPIIHRAGAITIVALLLVAIAGSLRGAVFSNDFVLFSDAVVKQPQSTYAHLNMALTLSEAVDIQEYSGHGGATELRPIREEALKHLILCEECPDFDRMLDPGRVRILIAVLNERLGHADEAYAALMHELKDKSHKAYNVALACQSLARIELARGQPETALKWLDHGIKVMSATNTSEELLYLKGLCFEALKQFDAAKAIYIAIPVNSMAYERAQQRLRQIR